MSSWLRGPYAWWINVKEETRKKKQGLHSRVLHLSLLTLSSWVKLVRFHWCFSCLIYLQHFFFSYSSKERREEVILSVSPIRLRNKRMRSGASCLSPLRQVFMLDRPRVDLITIGTLISLNTLKDFKNYLTWLIIMKGHFSSWKWSE